MRQIARNFQKFCVWVSGFFSDAKFVLVRQLILLKTGEPRAILFFSLKIVLFLISCYYFCDLPFDFQILPCCGLCSISHIFMFIILVCFATQNRIFHLPPRQYFRIPSLILFLKFISFAIFFLCSVVHSHKKSLFFYFFEYFCFFLSLCYSFCKIAR